MADRRYDAFLSHAREHDGALATALTSGLQRLGRRWRDRVALRVFLDRDAMGTEGNLPGRLHAAMDESDRFVLLACPEAAARPWVERELRYWLDTRGPDGILLVLTGGDCGWDDAAGDFDRQRSTAIPPALLGRLRSQPTWTDLRWVHHGDVDPGSLRLGHPRFADGVAEVAAGIRGVDKSEIVGEAVRRRRRQRWSGLAAAAVAMTLLAVAVVSSREAGRQRDRAAEAGDVATSRALADRADAAATERLDVRLLLAASAYDAAPTAEARAALARAVIAGRGVHRVLPGHAGGVADLATGPGGGETLVTVDGAGFVRVWDTATGALRSEAVDARADTARLATDGRIVTVGVDLVARWHDAGSGDLLAEVELGDPDKAAGCDVFACDRLRTAISDDGGRVAAGTVDGQLVIAGPDGIEATVEVGGPVTGIVYAPGDRGRLYVADDVGIRAWDDGTGEPLGDGYVHEFTGWAGLLPGGTAFSPDGRSFGFLHSDPYGEATELTWYDVGDPTAWEWQGATGSLAIQDLDQPVPELAAIALQPDGTGAVVATDPTRGSTPVAAVFDISSQGSWRRSADVVAGPAVVTRVALLADGGIAIGGLDDAVMVLGPGAAVNVGDETVDAVLEQVGDDLGDWTEPLPEGFASAARSPDGEILAGVYGDVEAGAAEIVLVDDDGTPVAAEGVTVPDTRSVAFGASADILMAGTATGRITARSLATGATVATAELPGGPVEALATSPDGTWTVAATPAEVVLLETGSLARVATLVTRSGADARSDALYQAPQLHGVVTTWTPEGELAFGWTDLVAPPMSSDTYGPFPELEVDVEAVPLLPGAEETLLDPVAPAILVDLEADDLAATACRIANRNLSHTEWERLVDDRPYHAACPGLPTTGDDLPEPLDRTPATADGSSPSTVPDIPDPPLDAAVPPPPPPLPPDRSMGFPTDDLAIVERYFAGHLALGALSVDWDLNGPREHPYAVVGDCEDVHPINDHDMCITLLEQDDDHAVYAVLAGDPTKAYGYATHDTEGWTPTDWWTRGLGPAPAWAEHLPIYVFS